MYDLLEAKDKCQSCKKLVIAAVVIFICSCVVLNYVWQGVPQAITKVNPNAGYTSSFAWQHFLKMLAREDLSPIKIALNTIEFKHNSLYLTGKAMYSLDKDEAEKMLKKYNWHIKKFDKGAIIINKDLRAI
jgi:hypothetical protein